MQVVEPAILNSWMLHFAVWWIVHTVLEEPASCTCKELEAADSSKTMIWHHTWNTTEWCRIVHYCYCLPCRSHLCTYLLFQHYMVFHPSQNHPMGLSGCHLYLYSTAHMVPLHATNLHTFTCLYICVCTYMLENKLKKKKVKLCIVSHVTPSRYVSHSGFQ